MNKHWKKMLSLQLIILLLTVTAGCRKTNENQKSDLTSKANSSLLKQKTPDTSLTQLKIKTSSFNKPTLETYNGSFFTVKKPKGWVIETTGNYETFGFRMYDKEAHARQVFYYGSMSPILKSTQSKSFWKQYVNNGGFAQAKLYSDAPVLAPATAENFFKLFNDFASFALKYGIKHNFPSLKAFKALESSKRNSEISSAALDDSVIRGLFTQNGVPCEGLFAATVVDAVSYPVNNLDAGYYTIYAVIGVSAPTDEFSALESTLTEAAGSFQFSQSYIDQAVQQNKWETKAALQAGKTLSQAYDSYNKAWKDRQSAGDASAQKYGDSMLGYDRLYDSETSETYRAEYGFWEEYDKNREKYANQNLQMVPDSGYDLLNKPVEGYIMK